MYHNNIVPGGFHGNIGCRKGMDFSCLQNIADGGEVDENEKFAADEVTSLVPAKYPPNEFYNSRTESEKYGHNAKELNINRNGVLQLGNEPVKIFRIVERVKQAVQNVVELYPTEENVQSGLDLDLINETAEKLVHLTMSEVRCDDTNIHNLSAITKISPRNCLGIDLEEPGTPEVTELQHDEQLVPETEQECRVHHTENLTGEMDQSMKFEGLGQTLKKKRRKSASNNGPVSQSVSRPLTIQPSCDKLQKVRDAVERAIREHKTFTVQGTFPTIREAMRQRCWIEKEAHRNKALSLDDASVPSSITLLASLTQMDAKITEALLVARLLRNVNVDFLWTMRSEPIDWQAVQRKQIVNRFPRAYFTTKVGLCSYLQHMHWFCENDVSHILFPRCYNVCQPDELTAFTHDFRLTACLGLLKWLVSRYEKQGGTSLKSMEGKIPFTAVEFALKRCQEYISIQTHEDIDRQDPIAIWDHQWDQFLTWYYLAVHDNFLLIECRTTSIVDLYESAKHILINIRKFWPQIDLDGMNNIWIVKPGAQSRGRGIQLTNKLEKVMGKVNPAAMKESRYVVQKYIECPLLIYDTKFDIRQWFLVTCAQPLTIWMYKGTDCDIITLWLQKLMRLSEYKNTNLLYTVPYAETESQDPINVNVKNIRESYLRFCSQPFDLLSMHESVHLCNNAVQSKYKNGKRNPLLPDENMWDCYTFQTYLRGIGHADMWEKCIYPGMRQSIICTLLASQEHMDRRRNCFELFGADFMLGEDFSPWLIEINSCPCMQPTTSVTARMCSQCLEDVIKVVIDKRLDRNASTGMFELIYRQHMPQVPPYLGMNLSVRGTKVHHPVPRTRSANTAKKHRDSAEEQESCNSGSDSNKKKKNVRGKGAFSKGSKMNKSKGTLGESRYDDYTEDTITLSKLEIHFESDELPIHQSEQRTSQENMVIHSKDSSDEQDLVRSDSEHTMETNSSIITSQQRDLESVNNEPQDKRDRNHSSDQLEYFDTKFETLLENCLKIHSKNGKNCVSNSCGNDEMEQNETELNRSSSNSEEQQSPNSAPEYMIQTLTLKVSESHQSLSSSPENTPKIKQARIDESKYSYDEGKSASSGPELNTPERRTIKVHNSETGSTVWGIVASGSDTTVIKKSLSTPKEQQTVKNGLQKTVKKNLRLKKFTEKSAGSGFELTMKKNNNCNVKKMKGNPYEEQAVNSTSEGALWKSENIRTKNSWNTSEKQELTNNWSEYKRGKKRSATVRIVSDRSEEKQLFDGDKEHAAQSETSSEISMYDSPQQQELASAGSENEACKNDSVTKHARRNYEGQGLRHESESPSQNKKNCCEKKSADRSGTEKWCSRTEQLGSKSTQNKEISNFSKTHEKIKKTAVCIRPMVVNLTEDLTNEMNKTHKSEKERDGTAIYATHEHKKTNPSNKPSSGSITVDHGKVSQMDKETNMVISEDEMEAEIRGRNVMDVRESEGIPQTATAVIERETDGKATKTVGTSWPYPKDSPHVSHFTEAIYPTVEEVIQKGKKHYFSGWRKSNDADKSKEFFNDWKKTLDHTKASCQDILAKLKMVRDNENVIHKPDNYSTDKGITWEGGTANKPTINDIIKKLSQTQPEREFFTCNIKRQVIATVPELTLSKRKERRKIQQCDPNMISEDNINPVPQHNQRSITPYIYSPSLNWSPVSVAILPHIKHRIKQPSSNNFFCNGHKFDNLYTVGMSLKTLQRSHNLQQHLLLPLGSDHCLRVSQLFNTHKRKLPTL